MAVPSCNRFTEYYVQVPAAFMLAHTPHFIGSIAAGRNYELANPRRTQEHCERDESMDKAVRLRFSSTREVTARH